MLSDNKEIQMTPLREALLKCRIMIKYILVFGCIINLLMLATPLYSMQVLDRVLGSSNLDTLLMLALVVSLAVFLLSCIRGARSFVMTKMGNWLERSLSNIVFENSVRMSLHSRMNIGSQKMRDLQTVKTFLISPQLINMMDTPWSIIFIIVLFILHPWVGWLAISGGVVLIFMALVNDRFTKQLIEKNNENFIVSARYMDQATRNAEVVEVMGMIPNLLTSWQKINIGVQNTQNRVAKRQATLSEITSYIRMTIQILVTALGAILVVRQEFTAGKMIACSTLVGRALVPFEHFMAAMKSFITFKKSYARLQKAFEVAGNETKKMSLPSPKGELLFENVTFAPQGSRIPIIKSVNFSLKSGEVLVVIGPSAAGKTTLAKLMVGIWHPNVGSVRLDKAALKEWNRYELGQYIGYLPQDVELFAGTIRENIARMKAEASAEEIVRAAKMAGIHEMILQLPQGYDTKIGLDGATLSGGQKQRVGLARALFGDVKLLILDEPNSSLDEKGEEALSDALSAMRDNGVTTIVISHRPSILNIADKVMVMSQGAVSYFGSKESVMKKLGGLNN